MRRARTVGARGADRGRSPLGVLLVAALVLSVVVVQGSAGAAPSGQGGGPVVPAPPLGGDPLPTDQVVVRFADRDRPGLAGLAPDVPGPLQVVRQLDDGAWVLRLARPLPLAAVEALTTRWQQRADVVAAEPDAVMEPTRVPNDPQYATHQWHYHPPVPGTYGANLPAAWDITTGSPHVVVAVLDTGKLDHVDLVDRYVPGYDFVSDPRSNDGDGWDDDPSDPGDWVTLAERNDPDGPFYGCAVRNSSWHGTHVAGTIGASTDNGVGVAGVDWAARILPVRVLGKCGGYWSDLADGIRWAAGLPVTGVPDNANPADVINMSLGGGPFALGACDGSFLENAIHDAIDAGAAVVASAGNNNADVAYYIPASCDGVISVAATARTGNKAWYSNFGSSVTIAAPGGDTNNADPALRDTGVRSTLNTGLTEPEEDSYAGYQGTSMAAPHVAGVVSLMRAVHPSITVSEIVELLRETATPFPEGSTCTTSLCGPGILDAAGAVAATYDRPTVSIGDAAVVEGDTGKSRPVTFSVHLSEPSEEPVTVGYDIRLVPGSIGAQVNDLKVRSGTVKFRAGITTRAVKVVVYPDTEIENQVVSNDGDLGELFEVVLRDAPPGYRVNTLDDRLYAHDPGPGAAVGAIIDDDPPSGLRVDIGDATLFEGTTRAGSTKVWLTLSDPAPEPVTVTVTTLPEVYDWGYAKLGKSTSRTVTFKTGQYRKAITLKAFPNADPGFDFIFPVLVTDVSGPASPGRSLGYVSFRDDD
jgi:serine protease